MLDNVRKCKNFLSTLLKLASNQPAATVQNVKNLIQGLVVSSVSHLRVVHALSHYFSLHYSPRCMAREVHLENVEVIPGVWA
jgi:hypothetical protein